MNWMMHTRTKHDATCQQHTHSKHHTTQSHSQHAPRARQRQRQKNRDRDYERVMQNFCMHRHRFCLLSPLNSQSLLKKTHNLIVKHFFFSLCFWHHPSVSKTPTNLCADKACCSKKITQRRLFFISLWCSSLFLREDPLTFCISINSITKSNIQERKQWIQEIPLIFQETQQKHVP